MSTQPVVSTFEEGSIADTAERARQLLLCCRDIIGEELQRLASTQLARFNLWASNIGVFASQHASLDYRLRTAFSVRAAVEGNIEIVCKNLLISIRVLHLTGLCINWHFYLALKASPGLTEEEFDMLFNIPRSQVSVFAMGLLPKTMPNGSMRIEAFKTVEAKITLLHQLSLAIRRASNRDNLTRIPKLFNVDREYVIISGQKEDGSNFETVIESVRFDIGAEFEEYVRKALTHRWLRHRSNDDEDLDKEQHNYRQTLLERCTLAVSTRRRQLEYFREHQNRLQDDDRRKKLFRPPGPKSATQDNFHNTKPPSDKSPLPELPSNTHLNQSSKIFYEASNYTHDETIGSEFVVAEYKPPLPSSAPSSSASTTTDGGFGREGPFDVPQPPKLDGSEREKTCPYCYLVLPAKTFSIHRKAKRWERHLLEDLQPYVCLFTNCTAPGKTYSSFGAWKSHLSQPHYHRWQCSLHPKNDKTDDTSNTTDDGFFMFDNIDQFKIHLKIFHPDYDATSANDLSQHVHKLAYLPQWCFVCCEELLEPAVLLQHMTKHLKSMSLLALPWRDDIVEDEAVASDRLVNSDAVGEQSDVSDPDLAGISLWGGEETDKMTMDSTQALDARTFNSILSAVNETSMTSRDHSQSLETWTEKLKSVQEMSEPEQKPARPLTPEAQAIPEDPSNDQSFEQKDEGEHSSSSGKSTGRGEMLTSSSGDKRAMETQIYLGDNNAQHIASGGTGHQYTGQGRSIYSDPGITVNNNMNAATHTFENSREQIIQALYTSPYLQRKNRNPDRVTGTCEWFLNHVDYHNWRDSMSSSMLWVSANPGCGKSVLAKCLVDELKTTQERTTCYFFFKDDFEDQRSAKSAISCILHQLFIQRKNLLSAEIIKRFKSYKAPLANSYYDLWKLWDILIMASQDINAGEIICILDAFDECEDQDRQDLAKIVREFYIQNGTTKQNVDLKFLITSRPYEKIRQGLVPFNLNDVPIIHLKGDGDKEMKEIAEEISLFIMDRVSRVRKNFGLTEKEEELLLHGLKAVPNQTYLWVYLTLDWIDNEIHNKISEMEIHNAVSVLPRTVDEAYDKILSKSTDVAETKKLLHIVVSAERPLTLKEMDLALTLQPHHKSYRDLKQRPSDRFRRYIRDLCGLFINIKDEKIYLLHQTAKEFLVPLGHYACQEEIITQQGHMSQVGHHKQLKWKSSLIPSESHRIIFKACVWYLLFIEFEIRPLAEQRTMSDYLRENPFLDYSATNWAAHFRASNNDGDDFRKELQQICDANSGRFLTWFRIFWGKMNAGLKSPRNLTTLMVASYFGIEALVRLQLDSPDVQLDRFDSTYGRSALSYAAESGFESIVKLLIKGPKVNLRNVLNSGFRPSAFKGATVDATDKAKRTPLSFASLNGHLLVVRVLVKAGARADLKDIIGGTPLSYALSTGRQDIANELTTRAQEYSINEIRDALFLSAVENGHQLVAKRLLDSGANIEAVNKDDETPLFIATRYGHTGLAQLLIERGANIEAVNKDDETPIFIATRYGHTALAQLLIERGADGSSKQE